MLYPTRTPGSAVDVSILSGKKMFDVFVPVVDIFSLDELLLNYFKLI